MNKTFTTILQTLALSLLLTSGAQAAGKPMSANKASVTSASTGKASAALLKVNINTADAAAIDQALVNVGPSKAAAIVAYRKEHGAFRSADQLAEVKGIGLKTIEKNRERIVIGTVAAAAPRAVKH
jgi:competence protein ComEA